MQLEVMKIQSNCFAICWPVDRCLWTGKLGTCKSVLPLCKPTQNPRRCTKSATSLFQYMTTAPSACSAPRMLRVPPQCSWYGQPAPAVQQAPQPFLPMHEAKSCPWKLTCCLKTKWMLVVGELRSCLDSCDCVALVCKAGAACDV